MKISKNNSININNKDVQTAEKLDKKDIQRSVQHSLYEKGSSVVSGQYFNPSFGNSAVSKSANRVNKTDLEKFNSVLKSVTKKLQTVLTDDLCAWDRHQKKVEILTGLGLDNIKAEGIVKACKTDAEFANYISLKKCNVDSFKIRDLSQEQNLAKFKKVLSAGESIKDAQYLYPLEDYQQAAAKLIAKNNVSIENASNAVKYIYNEQELSGFTNKYIDITKKTGFNEYNRAIAALPKEEYLKANRMFDAGINPAQVANDISILKSKNFENVLNVSEGIIKLGGIPEDNKILSKVNTHLDKRPEFDVNDFAKFIKSIDKDKMLKMNSSFKDYTQSDWLKFVDFHYRLGTKEFDKKSLMFPKDLTTYLSKNYLDGKGITSLFKVYPSTAREVGEMPSKWGIKTKEAEKQIYDAIEKFREKSDINQLSKDLTDITGKKTSVNRIGAGNFGTAYRISMDGAEDTCLKIFHKEPLMSNQIKQGSRVMTIDLSRHGPNVEPQAGLYVNENVEGYVKMYFGKVAPNNEKDAFYVTQYLDDKIKPIDVPDPSRNIKNTNIVYGDMKPANVVHDKIIDYGGIRVLDSNGEFFHWKVGEILKE